MHILSGKKISLCYVHYQTIETIFEINIVICPPSYLSFPTSPFDIFCVILTSKSKNWAGNELTKQKIINYHIKGL